MVLDSKVRECIVDQNLIGNGGAGRIYSVSSKTVVKLFYRSRTRTTERDAKHELSMGIELRKKGVQVPEYYRVIEPNEKVAYWLLLMERLVGEEPLHTIGYSRREAERQHKEQIKLLSELGYFSFDHLEFGNNSLFSLSLAKLFLIDLTHMEKY